MTGYPARGAPTRLLIVEDEPSDIYLLSQAFAGYGARYALHMARTLQGARDALAAEQFDLVIVDVELPDGSGLDLLETRRGEFGTPVLVMTRVTDESAALEAMQRGAIDYVTKSPETFADLRHVADRALREWALRQERQRAMVSLRESEERLRVIVQHLADGVVVVDDDGVVQFANPAAERFLGVPRAELVGLVLGVPVSMEAPADVQVVAPDGTIGHGEVIAVQTTWAGRRACVVSMRDTTERRRAEARGREMAAQLVQAQRLEAVGRLAAGVGHGFNEQLTAIRSYADFLLHHIAPGDPARADVRAIDEAVRQGAALAQQLLTFSRAQVLRPIVLDTNAALRDLAGVLTRLLGANVKLVFELAPETGAILFDPSQVGQVITNLATNARDAMPDGGSFVVATSNVKLDDAEALALGLESTDLVRIEVSDTGTGMDAATQARLFEPLFTTKGEAGTGLGLSTVYGIVTQSGGRIRVQSEVGRGTRFELLLPRSRAPALAESAPPCSEVAAGGETVLVVEDEEIVRRATCRALREQGYEVLQARYGIDALELESNHQGPIHLLLTDVVMPGMSGPELAQALRERRPEIGVVFMSGYADDSTLRQDDEEIVFVSKPFPIPLLMRKLRSVLARRRAASPRGT